MDSTDMHAGATPDHDPAETQEWIDALKGVLENEGPERAHFLLEKLVDVARRSGGYLPFSAQTGEGRDELASALMSLLAMPDWKMPESDEAAEPAETVEE